MNNYIFIKPFQNSDICVIPTERSDEESTQLTSLRRSLVAFGSVEMTGYGLLRGLFISLGLITTSLATGCADYSSVYKEAVIPAKSLAFDADKNEIILPVPCPDWRDNPIINADNSHTSNLGCATLNNKAQMVANPQDLLQGRGSSNAETESSVRTIEQYYNGELTPTIASDESSTTSDTN